MTRLLKEVGIPLIFAAGVAWGTATVTGTFLLRQKLDVETYRSDLERRASLDSTIVHELRTIRYLQCRAQPNDSYCGSRP